MKTGDCCFCIGNSMICSVVSIKHGLRTTDCGLGIKHGQGIRRGLWTADWV